MSMVEMFGLVGVALVVGSYALLNVQRFSLRQFNAAVLISVAILLPYGYLIGSPTVIVINFFWGLVALCGLLKKQKK